MTTNDNLTLRLLKSELYGLTTTGKRLRKHFIITASLWVAFIVALNIVIPLVFGLGEANPLLAALYAPVAIVLSHIISGYYDNIIKRAHLSRIIDDIEFVFEAGGLYNV